MRVHKNDKKALKKAKKLLIVVDMLNGFVKEGALAANNLLAIVPKQKEIINKVLESNDTILIFMCDAHNNASVEFLRYPKHCLKGSNENMIIDELKPFQKDALTYYKNSTNFIYRLQKDLLSLSQLERVDVIGCLSEICVYEGAYALRTFFDEYDKLVRVGVYKEAIGTYDSKNHSAKKVTDDTIKVMKEKGIEILD